MKYPVALLAIVLCAVAAVAQQQPCPIAIKKVDPRSFPLGASGDPWDRYLRIEYANWADRTSVAVKFGVYFFGAMGEAEESVYSYTDGSKAKPGQTRKPFWGDGVYFHQYGYNMQAMAWVEKIRFEDGTVWQDDGSKSCGTVKFTAAKPYVTNGAIKTDKMLQPAEQAEMTKQGTASRLVVFTSPQGAEVFVDGKKVGVSPLAIMLLKKPDDAERTVTISLKGYKTVERKYKPDGTPINLSPTLEPES